MTHAQKKEAVRLRVDGRFKKGAGLKKRRGAAKEK
jgi:hypothetical protein